MRHPTSILLFLLLALPSTWVQASTFVLPARLIQKANDVFSQRPKAQEPAFEEGSFVGANGAEIRYLFRKGEGPTILVIHGTILASEAQKQGVTGFFPGRPVMAIYRRGYSPSELKLSGKENIGPDNTADIVAAIEIARELGRGNKVCILAYSLGAMLLPPTDPEKILWTALVNPAAPNMLSHMSLDKQGLSWSLKNAYAVSRYWHPTYRKAWLQTTSQTLVDDLIDRIRAQQSEGDEEFSDFLINRIHTRMQRRDWQELIIQERLWALFPDQEMNIPQGIPVLIAASSSDGLIPKGAHDGLVERLRSQAVWVDDIRWPGGHLTPMFQPEILLKALGRFDKKVLSARP